ncbi:hypothetical protein AB0L63_23850 [Nocardia sp. NPDC051990]|uniref:hypothetical protein n=1 Tax=Nocardia sp. NPDC051990 TaxID=3155285 RepID=UPI0034141486
MSEVAPDLLLSLTVAAAQQLGYSCRVAAADDVVLSGPAGDVMVGLTNLRRMAADEPPDQWPALVADYLSTGLVDLELDSDPLDTGDFAMVQGLIRTRLYSEHGGAPDVVRRQVAPGLIQRVLIDQVHTMAPVTYAMARQWPIDEYDLFALAEQNTRGDGPLDVLTHRIDVPNRIDMPSADGVEITTLCGISDYITAHACWLDEYPVIGPAGAVFVVPSQRHIYAHPVADLEVVQATTLLAQVAMLDYTQRPWPVSQDVYWWHSGTIELAAATQHTGDSLRIYPSDDFLTALNELP